MGDIATLRINSVNYKGWKGFSISKSIETIANAFSLSVTDNWNGEVWPIKPGDLCEVFLSDELLITGSARPMLVCSSGFVNAGLVMSS